jgi:hypothetical protein
VLYLPLEDRDFMATHKLLVDDFYDASFSLIAVHCRLEDYRFAYLLNKNLNLRFKRSENDLDINYFSSSYSIYEWNDEINYTTWHLISNICKKEEDALQSSGSLFTERSKAIKTYNLIPEYKKVDYFLKVESDAQKINEGLLVSRLKDLPQLITAYVVNPETIKSKDYLIF